MKRLAFFALGAALIISPVAAKKILGVHIFNDKAQAAIIDARGLPIGFAKFVDSEKKGLSIEISVRGLTPGEHGIHLHSIGQCSGPDFASAGPHWNPQNHQHGRDNPQGSHAGDLPNLLVGRSGKGKLKFDIAAGRLYGQGGLLDDDGGALVIHAQSDDHRTDPSGNSGTRIACGVIVKH
jgi:superoxide dismutase, Cu-Zn family